jgi:hypothetical protein
MVVPCDGVSASEADGKMQFDRRLQSRLESLLFESWGACRPSNQGLSAHYFQPVGGLQKLGGLVTRVKLAALSASKAGASSPVIKRNPNKTLEQKYLGDALRLHHNLNNTRGGSVTSMNSGLLLPAVGLSYGGPLFGPLARRR